MNLVKKIILILIITIVPNIIAGTTASAYTVDCKSKFGIDVDSNIASTYIFNTPTQFTFTLTGLEAGGQYTVTPSSTGNAVIIGDADPDGNLTVNNFPESNNQLGDQRLRLNGAGLGSQGCNFAVWEVIMSTSSGSGYSCDYVHVYQSRGGQTCYAGTGGCLQTGIDYTIKARVLIDGNPYSGSLLFQRTKDILGKQGVNQGNGVYTASFSLGTAGTYTTKVMIDAGNNAVVCYAQHQHALNCGSTCLGETNIATNVPSGSSSPEPYKICEQIDRYQGHLEEAYNNCIECVGSDINGQPGTEQNPGGLWTAMGCIPRDPTAIVQNLLRVGLGMGGGVALLMILAAGFLFSISQGDPKRTGEAKELITAAITGLLFIIFSVVILQFIGYTVLQIPGFGG